MLSFALVLLCLMTLPLHAGAIATADGVLDGPAYLESCDQTSSGPEVQCALEASGNGATAEASASFGFLLAQTDAGAGENWGATAEASASFSSNVTFAQTGIVTGTWFVSWSQGGDEGIPNEPGLLTIMGTDVSFEFELPGGFFVTVPFNYSGGPVDVSALTAMDAESPGSQASFMTLQLIGFSSTYTVIPDVPEPGTLGLVGLALLAGICWDSTIL